MIYCGANKFCPMNELFTNPVALTEKLISYPSVSPARGDIFDLIENLLTELGFTCTRLPFGENDGGENDGGE